MKPFGIDYSNFKSPFYNKGDDKNAHGEANLNPYVSIYGPSIYDNPPSSGTNQDAIHRFVLNVAPLANYTYPNKASGVSLVNLDTIQLYVKKSGDYSFGKDYEGPEKEEVGDGSCDDEYPDVYVDAPVPIKGAPIEFRKVYFQGIPRLEDGSSPECIGETSSVGNYYAYFACSKPIKQTCEISNDPNCSYNSRNEYFGLLNGEVSDWNSFDVGGGGLGESCNFQFEKFDVNQNSFNIRSLGGTINGLIPSNVDDIGSFNNDQDYYVSLVGSVDKSGITILRYVVETSPPEIKPQYNAASPPSEFKIFAFMCISGQISSSLCKSLQITPEVAYLDQTSDPYENICTWSIKTVL